MDMLFHTSNTSNWEAKVGGLRVRGQFSQQQCPLSNEQTDKRQEFFRKSINASRRKGASEFIRFKKSDYGQQQV